MFLILSQEFFRGSRYLDFKSNIFNQLIKLFKKNYNLKYSLLETPDGGIFRYLSRFNPGKL